MEMIGSRGVGSADGARQYETLRPGQVDVWILRTDALPAAALDAMLRLLSPAELERNARYRFVRDRELHAFGRGLTRILLSRYASRDPAEWSIGTEASGRPFVENPVSTADPAPGALDFNISHTPGLVAVALGCDVRVGVDVERRSDHLADPAIARAILAPEEGRRLTMFPPDERPYRLRRLWTLKEALTKATGKGLALDVRGIQFEIDSPGTGPRLRPGTVARVVGPSEEWWFHEAVLEGNIGLAVAVHSPRHPCRPVRLRPFEYADLLSSA